MALSLQNIHKSFSMIDAARERVDALSHACECKQFLKIRNMLTGAIYKIAFVKYFVSVEDLIKFVQADQAIDLIIEYHVNGALADFFQDATNRNFHRQAIDMGKKDFYIHVNFIVDWIILTLPPDGYPDFQRAIRSLRVQDLRRMIDDTMRPIKRKLYNATQNEYNVFKEVISMFKSMGQESKIRLEMLRHDVNFTDDDDAAADDGNGEPPTKKPRIE